MQKYKIYRTLRSVDLQNERLARPARVPAGSAALPKDAKTRARDPSRRPPLCIIVQARYWSPAVDGLPFSLLPSLRFQLLRRPRTMGTSASLPNVGSRCCSTCRANFSLWKKASRSSRLSWRSWRSSRRCSRRRSRSARLRSKRRGLRGCSSSRSTRPFLSRSKRRGLPPSRSPRPFLSRSKRRRGLPPSSCDSASPSPP